MMNKKDVKTDQEATHKFLRLVAQMRRVGLPVPGWVEAGCTAEAKAHVLLEELGEDAFIDALQARGYVVTEAE